MGGFLLSVLLTQSSLWPSTANVGDALLVCGASGDQRNVSAASDGQGGAYIVWTDGSGGISTIRGQHLDSSGASAWPEDGGRILVGMVGVGLEQPKVVAANSGFFLGYFERGSSNNRYGVAQFDVDGGNATGGIVYRTATNGTVDFSLSEDGRGGALFLTRDNSGTNLTTLSSTGIAAGPTLVAGFDRLGRVAADGLGGALVAVREGNGGAKLWRVAPGSSATTSAASVINVTMLNALPAVVDDGDGGAFMAAAGRVGGSGAPFGIYLSRVTRDGGTTVMADGGAFTALLVHEEMASTNFGDVGLLRAPTDGVFVWWLQPYQSSGPGRLWLARVRDDGRVTAKVPEFDVGWPGVTVGQPDSAFTNARALMVGGQPVIGGFLRQAPTYQLQRFDDSAVPILAPTNGAVTIARTQANRLAETFALVRSGHGVIMAFDDVDTSSTDSNIRAVRFDFDRAALGGPVDASVPDASVDAGVRDAGATDAGVADAGVVDAGALDAGVADAGVVDAGALDAGVPDAGVVDAGALDAGVVDAGVPDAGVVDAGAPDAGASDAGVLDAGSTDAGLPEPISPYSWKPCGCQSDPTLLASGVIGLLLWRRRRRGLGVVGVLLFLASSARAEPNLRLAFVGIQERSGVSPVEAKALSDFVVTELSKLGVYRVTTPDDLSTMLSRERQSQLLGCGDGAACLGELAGALNSERVLTGNVARLGSSLLVSFTLLDGTSGQPVARAGQRVESGSIDSLLDAVPALLQQLMRADPRAQSSTANTSDGLSVTVGARVEGELLGLGIAPAITGALRKGLWAGAITAIIVPSFGARLEGRVLPFARGVANPYAGVGATFFYKPPYGASPSGGVVLAPRAALGIIVALGHVDLSVDGAVEYGVVTPVAYRPLSVIVSAGAGWRFE